MIRKGFLSLNLWQVGSGQARRLSWNSWLHELVWSLLVISFWRESPGMNSVQALWSFQHRCHHPYKPPSGKEIYLPLAHFDYFKNLFPVCQISENFAYDAFRWTEILSVIPVNSVNILPGELCFWVISFLRLRLWSYLLMHFLLM